MEEAIELEVNPKQRVGRTVCAAWFLTDVFLEDDTEDDIVPD